MPGCHTTDILVEIWNRLEAEDEQGARNFLIRYFPNYERLYGVAIYKYVLHRRGLMTLLCAARAGIWTIMTS